MDNCVDLDPMEYHLLASLPSSEQMASSLVENLVTNNKIVIFSKSSCPHCKDTKTLLNSQGIQYKAVELDKMKEGRLVQNTLGQITDARTVPRVFINGHCVGGNSDLQSLAKDGKLISLMKHKKESSESLTESSGGQSETTENEETP